MTIPRIAVAGALALVLFALWAWALQQGNAGGTNPARGNESRDATLERQIAELRTALDDAQAERHKLSAEVDRLRAELDWLAPPAGLSEEEEVAFFDPELPESERPESQGFETGKQGQPSSTGIFDEALLLAQGMSTGDVLRLREIFESSQMDELYLRDRATREGWYQKPRFHRALERVRNQLREGLSEQDYDRMLYATGTDNRVVLTHLLHGSPALDAGLRDGDIVQSYNGRRIFQPRDLQRATRTSKSGDMIPIVIERDGEIQRYFVRAGPIGVQLNGGTAHPMN